MKTLSAKPAEVQHDWFVVDATGKTLGRLATEIAVVYAVSTKLLILLTLTLVTTSSLSMLNKFK